MKYYVKSNADNGSGCEYKTKTGILEEIAMMIDDCIKNGGTTFDIVVDADASCYCDHSKGE